MGRIGFPGFSKKRLIKKAGTTMLVSIAIAAVVVSFSLVTLKFLWSLSGHYNRVISKKNEAAKILSDNVDNIDKLTANFNVLEAGDVKATTILDALPSKYDYPALATTVESLVSNNGLTLKSFSGDDQEGSAVQQSTTPEPVEVRFNLSVSGSYGDIQKFIDNLDRSIRPMKITRLELKGSDTVMVANLKVTTYYQPSTSLDVKTKEIE